MWKCNRLAEIWLFILAFQLLQASSTSTYKNSCRYKRYKEVISVQGGYNCMQTRVKLGICVGTCYSHAIPIASEGDNEPRFQTKCLCCAPKKFVERTVRFGDGCQKSIKVSQIRSCECKNCSRRDL